MTWKVQSVASVGLIGVTLLAGSGTVEARPRLRLVRVKDADTLFYPGLAGTGSFPRLNNRNQIMFTISESGTFRAALWENGRLTRISGQTGYNRVLARGLNDSGQIAGEAQYRDSGLHEHGFVATVQGLNLLPVNPGAHIDTFCAGVVVHDINEMGAASGWGSYAVSQGFAYYRPVVWQGGGLIESGTIGAHPADSQDFHWPVLINNSGIIAGSVFLFYSAFPSHYHGYYGPPGAVTEVLPFPGGTTVYIWDINDQSVLAGQSGGSFGYSHAIVVSGGQKKDIHGTVFGPSTNSAAYAINDSGVAVGWWDGRRGLYHANDTTWLLDSLLVSRYFPDGPLTRLFEAIDINDQGVVLALYEGPPGLSYPCLLVPVDSGTIVNTDNDLPDLNPADGRCYTGNVTALGEDECSLRAAIQHSNAHAGPDTVRFRIPVPGVPRIQVNTPLPAVSEEVYIDAVTQPDAHRVEVAASGSLTAGHGLTLSAGLCTLRGLLFNGFPGNGLLLDSADYCHIERCHFGVRPDSVTAAGNGGHGIHLVNSFGTQIGDPFDQEFNLIAYNGGAGIYVESGTGHDLSFNAIHHNGGLGIDLAPPGVNRNDPLDADGGANFGNNYPYVDSVLAAGDSTVLFGTMTGEAGAAYSIQIYRSDTCDTSGYGEGEEPVGSTVVATGSDGRGSFQDRFAGTLDPGDVFTLTARGTGNQTSEFSPCWPGKKWLYLVDGHGAPLANRIFALGRVAHDPPVFTETLLDTVTTDSAGRIDVQPYYDAGQLHAEDSVKLSKALDYKPRFKPGPPVTDRAMTIYLDNGKFDSTDYEYYFDELDREPRQVVKLNHTTVGLNLVISVEWEADSDYFDRLETGLRDLSNYLYDVFDGQVRLDTIFLFNNGELRRYADVRIRAENTLRPHARVRGVFKPKGWTNLSRRWFGASPDVTVELSVAEWPMQPDHIANFRTLGHELGHYLFGFADEYFENPALRCSPTHFYGFMDTQYPSHEPSASEMSWAEQYANGACRNNAQYVLNKRPCWEQWEQEYQVEYNGVYADILRPAERMVPGAGDHFHGPNDLGGPIQYDVGELVQFHLPSGPRAAEDKLITFTGPGSAGGLKGMDVSTLQTSQNRIILQGHTASTGGLWVLGVVPGDSLFAAKGQIRRSARRAQAAADTDHVWYSVAQEIVSSPGDSLAVEAQAVSGYLPANVRLELGSGDAALWLETLNPFGASPEVQFWPDPDSGDASHLPMNALAGVYQVTLPLADEYGGTIRIRALDTASAPFFFDLGSSVLRVDSTAPFVRVNAVSGSAYLDVDSLVGSGRVSLTTCTYLPVRTGLDASSQQLGPAVSVSSNPGSLFTSAHLVIAYGEIDLAEAEPPFDGEATVRLFAWDDTGDQWTLLGGAVDTAQNFVSATIPGPGLYAAFTTGQTSGIGDEHLGAITPETYELAQNHPNPFNPSTTISYYLPVPGRVTLSIHNVLGQIVRTLVDEVRAAGRHEVTWDGRTAAGDEVGSGVYFYQLRAEDRVLTRRMVLIK
jgi:hypothetical protein